MCMQLLLGHAIWLLDVVIRPPLSASDIITVSTFYLQRMAGNDSSRVESHQSLSMGDR